MGAPAIRAPFWRVDISAPDFGETILLMGLPVEYLLFLCTLDTPGLLFRNLK